MEQAMNVAGTANADVDRLGLPCVRKGCGARHAVLWVAMILSVSLSPSLRSPGALGAPKTPYGGHAAAVVWGEAVALDPKAARTPAEASAAGMLYETLYRINERGDLEPLLASDLPEWRGRDLVIPLRRGVPLHDGRVLTAADVMRALVSLLDPGSSGAHVLWAVTGASDRLSGATSRIGIQPSADGGGIILELRAPYPEFPRLLASPRAAIAIPSSTTSSESRVPNHPDTAFVGSGPWLLSSEGPSGALDLAPFPLHRVGRPFLDRFEFRPLASRFDALSELRRRDASIVFGVPDPKAAKYHVLLEETLRGPSKFSGASLPAASALPREVVLISRGALLPTLQSESAHAALGRAINRAISAQLLGPRAVPTATLLEPSEPGPHPSFPPTSTPWRRTEATLLVSRDDLVSRRLAERVQLDLLRVGVSVVIERVPHPMIEARKKDRQYELLIDTIFADGPPSARPIDRLHALLSIAADFGMLGEIALDEEIISFTIADDPTRSEKLSALESHVRRRCGLIPIAARTPSVAIPKVLADLRVTPFGALDVSDTYISSSEGSKPR